MPRAAVVEERRAHKRQRDTHRALARAREAQQRQERTRRAAVIRALKAGPLGEHCRCPITPQTTNAELAQLGGGCTDRPGLGHPRYVCPLLDTLRRRLGR